jgi:uncharacterized protein
MRDLVAQHQALADHLAALPGVVVAFSGGVDSAFLLKVAADALGERCHAVTAVSVTMARSEVADARALGVELGLGPRHHLVESHELERSRLRRQPADPMCAVQDRADGGGRPHRRRARRDRAARHQPRRPRRLPPRHRRRRRRGARMPMVDAQLSKAEIRALSRQLGLRTWDKPQLACLSSRFPYGTSITPARLRQVDDLEDGVRALGFSQVRARFHDAVARLELPAEELARALEPGVRDALLALGKRVGFTYVTVDLAGFRSGSMNEALPVTSSLVTLRRTGRSASS